MEPFIGKTYQEGEPQILELQKWAAAEPRLAAGFTGRGGGVSEPPYGSLNLALHVGDRPEDVLENRRRLALALGFEPEALTCGEQTHGSRVAVVTADDRGRGRLDRESAFQETDGLVTDVPGILLTSFYADCVPLYFFDPVHRAVGLAHAGWKGTVAEIAAEVVKTMQETYGTETEQLLAAIGPSIGESAYEVDDKVMQHVWPLLEQLGNDSGNRNEAVHPYKESPNDGRWLLNLKELNRMIMIKAGIMPSHIECTGWCTSTHVEIFFSHRKENGKTGRMASFIGLKER
ncbi:multicopper polyphenol oxidase [Paenibacillus yonginensis]|uniref:Purine nucleoside phosphorylase n=1 Tax=Paenibacillus yonginensis TaxID=1462996 RepID=A0A1B1N111_9BACL|nr:peptidoglycan editing factor PgeF [Paenibacillus yonginensis]ANS75101.1 multicopper polyphenol oxidase [Paenibacillus yonginensis]